MDESTPYGTAIASITAGEAQYRLQRAVLSAHKKLINRLVHRLAGADDISVYADRYQVQVSCNLTQLDGFKAPRLMRTLAEFAGDEWAASMYEYPGSLNRDFTFTMPSPSPLPDAAPGFCIRIRVCAYVRSDSPTCKKVLIGKKRTTHVEKQYRIECN